MHFQLGISLGSAPLMVPRGDPPDPNAPDIASVTIIGDGEIGSPLSYAISYATPPYPSPTRSPQWLSDGEIMDGETGHTYTPTADDESSVITVSLFVQNSEGFDTAVSTGKLITWPAPILQNVAVSPSSGVTGDTFTVSYDVVGFGLTLSHQWVVGGVDVEGATNVTYQARPEDGTASVTCRVRAVNSGGSAEETASPAANVTYSEAPALSGWAITPSSGVEAGDALVVQGTVTGVPTPDLTYQWTLDGSNITGETAATLGSAPEGAVRCVITATNSEGSDDVTVGPVTVSAITPGAPTISGIPDRNYSEDTGVQTLDLSTYATGDNLTYTEIQTDNLTSISALTVQEGVGGTRDCSGAFPYAAPAESFSYALTGASATFTVGSDPRGGITAADLPAGVSINATTGLVTVSAAAADQVATNYTVWKYNQAVGASQTLSITITATPDDLWEITPGAEQIAVSQHPTVSAPTVSAGVETIERTA